MNFIAILAQADEKEINEIADWLVKNKFRNISDAYARETERLSYMRELHTHEPASIEDECESCKVNFSGPTYEGFLGK